MNLSPFQAKHTKTYLLIDTDTICDMCYILRSIPVEYIKNVFGWNLCLVEFSRVFRVIDINVSFGEKKRKD